MTRLTCNRCDTGIVACQLQRFFDGTFLIRLCSIAVVGLLLTVFPVALSAQAPASVFSLDELPSAPSSACPQYVFVRAEGGALALSSGRLLRSDVAVPGNTSTVYVTCSGGLQLTFQPPSRSISFVLINGSSETRTFIVSGQDFLAMTHDQPVPLPGRGSAAVTVTHPFDLWGVSIRHQNVSHTSFFAVDNIAVTFQSVVPPVTIQFDLGVNAPEKHRRVLTHKYRQDDEYPSPAQHEDGKIEIRVKVTDKSDGTPAAGRKVYFRVVDPPDESPYTPQAEQLDNDNADVWNEGSVGVVTPTSATSDSDGVVSTALFITSQYAGDNYAVEASPDPEFPAGKVTRSGVLTAWKRVYLEQNRMFRRGTLLTSNVAPGDTTIAIADQRPFPRPPFQVKLVHGPGVREFGGFFCEEIVTIGEVIRKPGGNQGTLVLQSGAIANRYVASEVAAGDARSYLSDAVGLWTGTPDDHFASNFSLLQPLYDDAFVEYFHLPLQLAGTDGSIPFVEPAEPNLERSLMAENFLGLKWGRTNVRTGGSAIALPNHQVIFAASRFQRGSNLRLGSASVAGGFNYAWLYLSSMTTAVEREAVVHELTHQWRVNHGAPYHHPGSEGHCDTAATPTTKRYIYNSPSRKCVMTANIYQDPEATDGIVGFHYVTIQGQRDSEFLRIRHREEPIPQSEQKREFQP